METITHLRNVAVYPTTAAELRDLRTGKWRAYRSADTQTLTLAGRPVTFRSGLTLTPFANPTPCNAHCRFCSEELRRKHQNRLTAQQLIGDHDRYFAALERVLADLSPLRHVGLSLSGLEATSDPLWLLALCHLLGPDKVRDVASRPTCTAQGDAPRRTGGRAPAFDERVLYTNGSGLATHPELITALAAAGFDRIELSRCHYDEAVNQRIMYINRNEPVHRNAAYEGMVRRLHGHLEVKNSCILTRGGVDSVAEIERYLDWALDLGVRTVVFRELSRLNDDYAENRTKRWTDEHRVAIDPLLRRIAPSLTAQRGDWAYQHSVQGYYYYNEHYLYKGMVRVILEVSSYDALIASNADDAVQKLVFHSNGNLCGDWDPDSQVLKNYFD